MLSGLGPFAGLLGSYDTFESLLHHDIEALKDDNLTTLEHSLLAAVICVRRQRNQHSVLNRLPEEILISILLQVRDFNPAIHGHDGHYGVNAPDTRTLFAMTHVCHRIRTIALEYPPLWTVIPPSSSSPYTTLFTERSGSLPFHVHAETPGTFCWMPPAVFHSQNRSRIKELFLVKGGDDASNFGRLLYPLAPTLSYLNMTSESKGLQARHACPVELFSGARPESLVALAISLRTGVLPIDTFPVLSHLRLSGSGVSLGVGDLLHILSNAPLLETLHVVDTELDLPIGWDDGAVQTVRLERLQAFCLDGPAYEEAFAVLRHVSLPPNALVQLHRLKVTKRTDLSAIALPELEALTSLEVADAEESHSIHVRARGERGGFWVHLSLEDPPPNVGATVASLLASAAPALASVDTLRIVTLSPLSVALTPDQNLLDTMSSFSTSCLPSLTTLILAWMDESGVELAPVLQRALSPSSDPPGSMPFPTLQNLVVQTNSTIVDHESLAEMLAGKAHVGTPIRLLCLNAGHVKDEKCLRMPSSTAMAGHASQAESTNGLLCDPAKDSFWGVDCPYWPLYPEDHMRRLWARPRFG